MLPAQPPNSRLSVGTRNETLSTCSWLGMIWSAKRPPKLAMLSKASDPQTRAAMRSPKVGRGAPREDSGIEDCDRVADHRRGAGGQQHLELRLGARRQHLGGIEVARRE